jgi:hypothetical protein
MGEATQSEIPHELAIADAEAQYQGERIKPSLKY